MRYACYLYDHTDFTVTISWGFSEGILTTLFTFLPFVIGEPAPFDSEYASFRQYYFEEIFNNCSLHRHAGHLS